MNWGRFIIRGGLAAAVIEQPASRCCIISRRAGARSNRRGQPRGVRHGSRHAPRLRRSRPARPRQGKRSPGSKNRDLDMDLTRLQGQRDRQALHLKNLRGQQGSDPAAAAQIPIAEEALADVETRLADRRRDRERLTLTAPQDGTVLPPHRQPLQAELRRTTDLDRDAARSAQSGRVS